MAEILNAWWLDGRHPQTHAVQLSVVSGLLHVKGADFERQYAWTPLALPSSVGRFDRFCRLPDGSSLHHADARHWDDWCLAQGRLADRAETWIKYRHGAWMTIIMVVAFVLASWRWLIPAVSDEVVPWLSPQFERKVGEAGLAQIRALYLKPSRLSGDEQDVWRNRFEDMVAQVHVQEDGAPRWRLHVHAAPQIGPNAFALPGGDMVITDELLELLQDEPDAVMGILAHELGHVQHQHGLKMVVKASLSSTLAGIVLGDASFFFSSVPAILMSQGYSRHAERQADQFAAHFLHRNEIHPRVMTLFFERLASYRASKQGATPELVADQDDDVVFIGLASHPADHDRMAFFKNWKP